MVCRISQIREKRQLYGAIVVVDMDVVKNISDLEGLLSISSNIMERSVRYSFIGITIILVRILTVCGQSIMAKHSEYSDKYAITIPISR